MTYKNNFSENKKKDEGIYFTPSFITEYICKKVLLHILKKNSKTNSIKQLLFEYRRNFDDLYQKLKNLKIIDPSCGNGAFIIKMFHILIDLHLKIIQFQKKSINSNLELDIIKNNLYGVDINEKNINSLKKELLRLLNDKNDNPTQLCELNKNFKVGNSIASEKLLDGTKFDWKLDFKDILDNGGFDIVIGNPPWGANIDNLRDYYRKKYKNILKGQFDSFSIFLYDNIKNQLKKKGIIGFVVPNELCLLDLNKNLRKYLLKFKILEIINLGFDIFQDVQKPTLIIILEKEKTNYDINNSQTNMIRVSVGLNRNDKELLIGKKISLSKILNERFYLRNQKDFFENVDYNFDIFSDKFDISVKNLIKNNYFKSLKYYFKNGRGIDTNKEGKYIVCPQCSLLNPPFGRGHSGRRKQKKCRAKNCNYIFIKEKETYYKSIKLISKKNYPIEGFNAPGYIGEDLHKLYFNRKPRAFKYYRRKINSLNIKKENLDFSDIKWGKDDLYQGEKLLIRKVSTNHNLQVMVYKGFLITNQQIYIFKKRDNIKDISIYYFLGILASRLIHYYYIKEYGDPDKDILPHFTQSAIKSLPIPIISIDDKIYENIIYITKELIQFFSKYIILKNDNELKKQQLYQKIQDYYNRLDNNIFTLFNIHNLEIRREIKSRADKSGYQII